MGANDSAEGIEYACRFDTTYRTADVLRVNDQLAQAPARDELIQLAVVHRFLTKCDSGERTIPYEGQVTVRSGILHPHEPRRAAVKKLVGDVCRPIRALFPVLPFPAQRMPCARQRGVQSCRLASGQPASSRRGIFGGGTHGNQVDVVKRHGVRLAGSRGSTPRFRVCTFTPHPAMVVFLPGNTRFYHRSPH